MGDVRHREEVSPSYSWYVRDWRASFRVQQLSWKERGFYRECLDWSWDLDGLPNDLDYIRGRLHATKGDFDKMWPAASTFYDVGADGRLRNARQELERRKQSHNRRRASDGGNAKAEAIRQVLEASATSTPPKQASERASSTASSTASHYAPLSPSPSPVPSPLQRETPAAGLSPPAVSTHGHEDPRHTRADTSRDAFTDPAITERAGAFLRLYEQLYPKHRKGARYAVKPVRDYAAAVTLCQTWPDDRLEKLAVIFLTTDHKFAEEGSRTVPQFLAIASWCDGKLAEHDAKARPV